MIAILLSLVTVGICLLFGSFEAESGTAVGLQRRATTMLDAWRGALGEPGKDAGIWGFLGFSMQMCLILVTGHALAASRPVARLINALGSLPRSGAAGAALVALTACSAGLINWGLGLIVGALMAREVGRALAARGVAAHYPLICAAGYTGMLIWHGGLSGSAPLSVTTLDGAAKVLSSDALARLGEDAIPLTETIFAPMNLFVTAGLLVLIPLTLYALAPKRAEDILTMADCKVSSGPGGERDGLPEEPTLPDRLDRSLVIALLLAVPLLVALGRYAWVTGLANVGLNEVNATMLALGLILHGSPASYLRAAEEGARGCAGIILQFPLYAGIMAMLAESGLIQTFAESLAGGGETGVPLLTFIAAAVVNLFVPSGGGQWGIQGPVALAAGEAVGVAPGKMVMAVAYGDQLTNMLQPFWAVPLLAITGVRARDIVGYTAIVMVVAAFWIALGLLVF